jgi:hypothetical protein
VTNNATALLILLATLTFSGCATYRPCDPQLMPHTGLTAPPNECRVDGCTLAPEFDFPHCCDEHDTRYWAGGTADERKLADRDLRECILAAGHGVLSNVYYFGVRLGGTPYLPTPWRWGFGWDYPHGYASRCESEAAHGSLSQCAGATR